MSIRKTTEEFVSDAIKVHGDRYDYSKTVYKSNRTKIIITCPIHGDFPQLPYNHLVGKVCKFCANEAMTMKTKFIPEANKIHNDKYDYSKTVYNNIRTKVNIICPKHGDFLQTPYHHLQGQGCKKCYSESIIEKAKERFVPNAKKVHGDKYDYSKSLYKDSRTTVTIICPIHGKFEQRPNNHLQGKGCPRCAQLLNGTGYNESEHFTPYLFKILPQYTIEQQYPIYNKDTGQNYLVDFYIPEKNIVIEYDETHHKYQKCLDKERQLYIENQLKCKFIRVSDREFMLNHKYVHMLLTEDFSIHTKPNVDDLFE